VVAGGLDPTDLLITNQLLCIVKASKIELGRFLYATLGAVLRGLVWGLLLLLIPSR
jgi:hypothetical protein